jgi:hypothetical protein
MKGSNMDPFVNLLVERHDEIAGSQLRRQLITVVIHTFRQRGDADLIPTALLAVNGVEVVEPDPATARIWVFGNGAVDPELLIEALASWGYSAEILENQFEFAA